MKQTYYRGFGAIVVVLLVILGAVVILPQRVRAAAPVVNPKSGTLGIEGTISAPAPTKAANIVTPVNGRSFNEIPITVTGLCPQGTIVKLFSNNIFVGSVVCTKGSFSLQIDLFSGRNELIARVYDDLDQAGPDSAVVTVTFNDATFSAFDNHVNLSSIYARKGANPGETLSWPIILSGGTSPYALSVDWGDGKPLTLQSVSFSGTIDVQHIYDSAGIYRVIVKVSDSKGYTAYLQLIGVANGSVGSTGTNAADSGTTKTIVQTKYSIIPGLIAVPLIIASFILGRGYERQVLRRRIEATNAEIGE